jgi:putative salt-induced outer membrane protein YdiY
MNASLVVRLLRSASFIGCAVALFLPVRASSAQGPELAEPMPTTAGPEELVEPPSEPLPEPITAFPIDETKAPSTWYQPTYWLGVGPWDSAIELGLNGSSGTSDTLSYRTGGYFKGKTEIRKVDLSLYYNSTMSEGEQTQNNALFSGRHDWLLGKSPWSIYVLSQLFYDEFQAYDLNFNANSGIGYQWIDAEHLKLGTQLGAGASREFGGPNDRWAPEAQLGFDYEQMIRAAHKLTASVDYFPEFEHFGRYRVLTELGWEVALSQPENLSLKVAVTDRYDADPHGAKPHILNYSVLLLWKL